MSDKENGENPPTFAESNIEGLLHYIIIMLLLSK